MLSKAMACAIGAVAFVAAAVPAARAQMMVPAPSRGLTVYSVTGTPKADPGESPENWSARQNIADSRRYERLVRTDPAFRAARTRKECGGINEPNLYQQCIATFY